MGQSPFGPLAPIYILFKRAQQTLSLATSPSHPSLPHRSRRLPAAAPATRSGAGSELKHPRRAAAASDTRSLGKSTTGRMHVGG